MKLSTKIIFSYITAMVFPMIIIVGMIFGMIRYNLNSLKKAQKRRFFLPFLCLLWFT